MYKTRNTLKRHIESLKCDNKNYKDAHENLRSINEQLRNRIADMMQGEPFVVGERATYYGELVRIVSLKGSIATVSRGTWDGEIIESPVDISLLRHCVELGPKPGRIPYGV